MHMNVTAKDLIKRLNEFHQGTILETLGILLTIAEKDRLEAIMPITSLHLQPMGYLHGGISLVVAESLASLGATLNIDQGQEMAFGLEINANHLRSKRSGCVTARAIPLHRGKMTQVWEIKLYDEQEMLLCVARCTVAVVQRADRKQYATIGDDSKLPGEHAAG